MDLVRRPAHFDVIVASNLFGDILSDLSAAIVGGLGMTPSGNINPERTAPSMFEPVHGSAPDIAGTGKANPVGAVWAGAMMLDHLGETTAGSAIMKAVEEVLATTTIRTPDLGGTATTSEVGQELKRAIRAAQPSGDR
jgi:tartrate dehydrogenase/decarboxylase/D-malate dehydrogenase